MCGGEGLADFVVELAREVPAFGLLHFDQPAGKHLDFGAVFLAFCLGLLAANALFDFLHGAADGRDEPGETILEDIVRRAVLERVNGPLLAQRPRHED